MANHLPFVKKALVLPSLVEGNSIRSTERLAGVHRDTIMRLLVSKPLIGLPVLDLICTSHVESQNLTMRMSMRRFTRLINAYSKKLENLKAAVHLHFFHYNFIRLHHAIKCTPAMEAGITSSIWNWEDLLSLDELRKAA